MIYFFLVRFTLYQSAQFSGLVMINFLIVFLNFIYQSFTIILIFLHSLCSFSRFWVALLWKKLERNATAILFSQIISLYCLSVSLIYLLKTFDNLVCNLESVFHVSLKESSLLFIFLKILCFSPIITLSNCFCFPKLDFYGQIYWVFRSY